MGNRTCERSYLCFHLWLVYLTIGVNNQNCKWEAIQSINIHYEMARGRSFYFFFSQREFVNIFVVIIIIFESNLIFGIFFSVWFGRRMEIRKGWHSADCDCLWLSKDEIRILNSVALSLHTAIHFVRGELHLLWSSSSFRHSMSRDPFR